MDLTDNYRHKGLRRQLVRSLRMKGITDDNVLQAIENVPRHFFLDSSFLEFAYQDKAFPIGSGQTISQPYTVAFQTQQLKVKRGDKILEIGTGSGYQASILSVMGAKVFSIERQKALYLKTKKTLRNLRYKVKTFYGDGYKGLPAFAPFDKVIVTAGAPEIPKEIVKQMNIGGRMVIPIGETKHQKMNLLIKSSENEVELYELGDFSFVPMLQDRESS